MTGICKYLENFLRITLDIFESLFLSSLIKALNTTSLSYIVLISDHDFQL
jgi:hypothetical protein